MFAIIANCRWNIHSHEMLHSYVLYRYICTSMDFGQFWWRIKRVSWHSKNTYCFSNQFVSYIFRHLTLASTAFWRATAGDGDGDWDWVAARLDQIAQSSSRPSRAPASPSSGGGNGIIITRSPLYDYHSCHATWPWSCLAGLDLCFWSVWLLTFVGGGGMQPHSNILYIHLYENRSKHRIVHPGRHRIIWPKALMSQVDGPGHLLNKMSGQKQKQKHTHNYIL